MHMQAERIAEAAEEAKQAKQFEQEVEIYRLREADRIKREKMKDDEARKLQVEAETRQREEDLRLILEQENNNKV